ncbi:MAG: M56 family metallopeptidase [Ferruginibacter sp.]
MLYFLCLSQMVLSLTTFLIYYTDTSLLTTRIESVSIKVNSRAYIQTISPWLVSLYSFIVTIKCIEVFIKWHGFKARNRFTWIKPSIDLKLFTAVSCYQFGIKRKVTLWYSSVISTPLTFGSLKPVILLPVALVNNLSIRETETLIIHELTHIKNNDYILNWLLIICETIYFFNPFMKVISSSVKLEREKNCNIKVLQFKYPAISYAETLLKAAKFKKSHTPFVLTAVFQNAQLLDRIRFFTKENNLNFSKRNFNSLAIAPLILTFIFNLALLNGVNKIVGNEIPTFMQPLMNNRIRNEDKPGEQVSEIRPVVYSTAKVSLPSIAFTNKIKAELAVKENELIKMKNVLLQEQLVMENNMENIVSPVSITEADDTKELTIKEENSETGLSITKVYEMKFVKGEWKTRLKWMMTDYKPVITDSIHLLLDSCKLDSIKAKMNALQILSTTLQQQ